MTAAEITSSVQAQAPAKLKPKAVAVALAALISASHISMVKGLRKGSSQACYTTQKPLDLTSEALAKVVAALPAAVALTKLKGLIAKPLRPWFDEALGRLIVLGSAYYLPRGKTRLVQAHPPKPSELLAAPALLQLKKVLEQANRVRQSQRTMAELLAWLDEGNPEPMHIVPRPVIKPPTLSPTQLRAWHRADASGGSTAMVAIPVTFSRYRAWATEVGEHVDPEVFKRVLKALYDAGHAMLEPHERPHELPPHERELQVSMALGPPGYYWGLLD